MSSLAASPGAGATKHAIGFMSTLEPNPGAQCEKARNQFRVYPRRCADLRHYLILGILPCSTLKAPKTRGVRSDFYWTPDFRSTAGSVCWRLHVYHGNRFRVYPRRHFRCRCDKARNRFHVYPRRYFRCRCDKARNRFHVYPRRYFRCRCDKARNGFHVYPPTQSRCSVRKSTQSVPCLPSPMCGPETLSYSRVSSVFDTKTTESLLLPILYFYFLLQVFFFLNLTLHVRIYSSVFGTTGSLLLPFLYFFSF